MGCLGACCVATAWELRRTRGKRGTHLLPQLKADGGEGDKKEAGEKPKISGRELRYKAFASFVYKGEPYMSARDFLDSLIRNEPRCKIYKASNALGTCVGVEVELYMYDIYSPFFNPAEDKQVIDDRVGSK